MLKAFFVKSFQSCLTLCDPVDCSLPGSSVHVILQARTLEWITMSSSRGYSHSGIKPMSPALAGRLFATSITWEAQKLLHILLFKHLLREMVLLPSICKFGNQSLEMQRKLPELTDGSW